MIEQTLGDKLDPRRFPHMSSKMAALVAYVLGGEADFHTEPAIVDLTIHSNGIVFARHDDDGHEEPIGRLSDFNSNWAALVAAADLTPAEIRRVHRLLDARVRDLRPSWEQLELGL